MMVESGPRPECAADKRKKGKAKLPAPAISRVHSFRPTAFET
jgi:hypothetical protein